MVNKWPRPSSSFNWTNLCPLPTRTKLRRTIWEYRSLQYNCRTWSLQMWHISVWGYPCIIAYQLRQKLRAWRLSESWRHGVAAPLPVRHQQWFSSLEEIHIVIRPLYNLTHYISLFILINLFHYTSFLEWANIRTIENSIKALLLKKYIY